MNARTKQCLIVAAGFAGALSLRGPAAAEGEAKIPMEQVPPAALRALLEMAGNEPFTQLERETKYGAVVYEAEWVVEEATYGAAVTAEGAVLEFEESVPPDHLPAAVRATITKHFGANANVEIVRKTITVYEAEATVNGKEKEIHVLPTGRLHDQAEEEDDDENDD